ncbi:MAG: pyridoxamine 5'-phosphate oxidase family protein [Streptosporangiales bacterium]|nr:pyridoxamine 5'-phosphate oxidase family protein [Streptosporangiales bacterium]
MSSDTRQPGNEGERVLRPLTREQALRLLGTVPMGRIAFTSRAMPAIRPVNHMVDDEGRIIIRSHEGGSIVTATDAERGTVVSYEADQIDTETRVGWTVIVTGLARVVDDPAQVEAYHEALQPWVSGLDYIISIDPTIVTAYELVRGRNGSPARQPA